MNKKKFSIVWCLLIILFISFIGNLVLYEKLMYPKELSIQGTFQLGTDIEAVYILFDEKGNFCRYTQKQGILNNGEYQLLKDECYILHSDNTEYCVYQTEKGIYLFDIKNNRADFYTKLSSALVLYDISEDNWPDWSKEK